MLSAGGGDEKKSRQENLWENADHEASLKADAIERALEFAEEQARQDFRDFSEGFIEHIEDGVGTWRRLAAEAGFDLRGIFRRRELVPFVLIPRHVSNHHGEEEKLSLLTHLKQAHDAFVFGVPFAALALLRSIMEVTLRKHYQAEGKDLKEQIDNCRGLPPGAPRQALNRLRLLANNVLHFNNERVRLPTHFEKELLSLLYVLRALIEGAPTWRVHGSRQV
jgi:hypothetical protein